jgi:hypothetical protein
VEFKSNVCNKAALKGCIAEGYIATELVIFCSMYLNNVPTFYNTPQRNPNGCKGQEHESSSTVSH